MTGDGHEGSARAVSVALAGGVVALVVVFAVLLLDDRPHSVVPASRSLEAALAVPPFARACQPSVDVPAGTGRVELVVSTSGKPGPPLAMRIEKGDRVIARGRHPGRYVDSPVSVPITRVRSAVRGAQVCVTNQGLARAALLGERVQEAAPALGSTDFTDAAGGLSARVTLAGRVLPQPPERIHLDWQFADERSGLSRAGTVAERFGLVKASFFGSGTLWIALALTLLASLAALLHVAREAARQ